jgi:hypothetical protein
MTAGPRMPMIAGPARSANAVVDQTPKRADSGWLRKMRESWLSALRPTKVGCLLYMPGVRAFGGATGRSGCNDHRKAQLNERVFGDGFR